MNTSRDLFQRARNLLPGGVSSPVRAYGKVGGTPLFIARAKGAYLWDIEDKRYIDYVGSWGPMVLGHAHPDVIQAVRQTAELGLSFGAPTEIEIRLADLIRQHLPSMELLRMVSSGTEATMSAIRVARGFTGRDRILKFEGCYHGHSDALLVKAGSGALTFGEPDSLGIPADFARHTITARYNDLDQVRDILRKEGDSIACIIVEPVAGNMNCVPPEPGFLEGLRETCDTCGTLLIFDEVMTGFRVSMGGAQTRYNIRPDLTTLGKVIGGGMPVGAFGGRRDIMEIVAPLGGVYQAGTLSGNPVAMAAGLATLQQLAASNALAHAIESTTRLLTGLTALADRHGINFATNQAGSIFGLFFLDADATAPVSRFEQVMACDTDRFITFFHRMLNAGINLAPSPFEAGFMSSAHGETDIQATLDAADAAMHNLNGTAT